MFGLVYQNVCGYIYVKLKNKKSHCFIHSFNLCWAFQCKGLDICQPPFGALGQFGVGQVLSSWFNSGVISCHQVLPPGQPWWGEEGYTGRFLLRFWQRGGWVEVRVDDRLPCIDNKLCFSQCLCPMAFWVALLEKAYAKWVSQPQPFFVLFSFGKQRA